MGGGYHLRIITRAIVFYVELVVMLGFGIFDRINAIAGALIFAVSEAGGGGGRVLRAVLTWSECPPELFLTLQSSRPCCGVRILAIDPPLNPEPDTLNRKP